MIMASPSPDSVISRLGCMKIGSMLNPESSSSSSESSVTSETSIRPMPSMPYRERSLSNASYQLSEPQSRAYTSSPEFTSVNSFAAQAGRRISAGNSHRCDPRLGRERREFRPTYQKEEEFFIWYHRVDLAMDWPAVRNAYNAQFPERQRRGFQGIQCKYYRCCDSYGVPRVRDRNRAAGGSRYGLRAKVPGLWYPWMRCDRNALR